MPTNKEVYEIWKNNGRKTNFKKPLHTDGYNLYSYDLCIGITENNKKILFRHMSGRAKYYSLTTSRHCSCAIRYADEIYDVSMEEYLYGKVFKKEAIKELDKYLIKDLLNIVLLYI